MKKIVLSIVLSAACSLTLSAGRSSQDDGKSVSVTGTEVVRSNNNTVSLAFRLEVGSDVTAKNRSLIIRPVLQGSGGRRELPPIIIRGQRAKVAAENQAIDALGIDAGGYYLTSNGNSVDYRASILWQDWMRGSQLVFNGLNTGSDEVTEVNIGVVADNLLMGLSRIPMEYPAAAQQTPLSTVQEVQIAGAQSSVPQDQGTVVQRSMQSPSYNSNYQPSYQHYAAVTVGDELAARFTFVEPVARYNAARSTSDADAVFDYNMPLRFGTSMPQETDEIGRFIEMTRQGSIRIEFDRGSCTVDRSMGENYKMLVDLISSIRVLLGANPPDARVAQVVVVGFSAPDGTDEKETLAMERAEATRDFLTANSQVDPALISVYNGSVDWATLRALVAESGMGEKYKVLNIIDNIPAWGSTQDKGRMTYLMELGDGSAFNYMRENFFPLLRQTGAYVKVYYENVQ